MLEGGQLVSGEGVCERGAACEEKVGDDTVKSNPPVVIQNALSFLHGLLNNFKANVLDCSGLLCQYDCKLRNDLLHSMLWSALHVLKYLYTTEKCTLPSQWIYFLYHFLKCHSGFGFYLISNKILQRDAVSCLCCGSGLKVFALISE